MNIERNFVMNKRILLIAVSLLASSFYINTSNAETGIATTPTQTSPAKYPDFSELADKLLPTVVNVSTTSKVSSSEGFAIPGLPALQDKMLGENSPLKDLMEQFYGIPKDGINKNPDREVNALGSGFVIDAEKGYIATNNHVIKGADKIKIIFNDNTKVDAELVASDEKADLAVLKVKPSNKLVAAKWGDSDQLKVGSWIVAIGNPFGLGGTVTAGIVSARARDINSGPYDDYIQTDASINRGNSGGPMFNEAGEVVGINTAILSSMGGGSIGIGFAVPSNIAKKVIDQLIQFGSTKRGWLGVKIQPVTDEIAESLGLQQSEGAMVASVTEKSPSATAGLKSGDIILEFDGQKIDQMRSLPKLVAYSEVGKEVKLKVWRDGKTQDFTVKLGELEKAEKDGLLGDNKSEKGSSGYKAEPNSYYVEIKDLGIKVAAVQDYLATHSQLIGKYPNLANEQGVIVADIDDTGPAAGKDLQEGDVIVELDQQPVDNTAQIPLLIKDAEREGKSSILMFISRGGDKRFVAIKIKSEDKK